MRRDINDNLVEKKEEKGIEVMREHGTRTDDHDDKRTGANFIFCHFNIVILRGAHDFWCPYVKVPKYIEYSLVNYVNK